MFCAKFKCGYSGMNPCFLILDYQQDMMISALIFNRLGLSTLRGAV